MQSIGSAPERILRLAGQTTIKESKKHKEILTKIKAIPKKHLTYGVDSIWAEVKETIPCSRGTVYRLMKQAGIQSKRKKEWKATIDSKHNLPIAPNPLNQAFDTTTPNTVWVGDITYNWID